MEINNNPHDQSNTNPHDQSSKLSSRIPSPPSVPIEDKLLSHLCVSLIIIGEWYESIHRQRLQESDPPIIRRRLQGLRKLQDRPQSTFPLKQKRYAFVQFESERCAEEARLALQNTNFSGLRLNIEWSKNSGRFNENTKSKNDRGGPRRRRSNSRERSWRKEDRIFRRSPSFEKRHAPTYSDNEDDLETFVSKSPRDAEYL